MKTMKKPTSLKLALVGVAASMLAAPAVMSAEAQAANVYVNGGYTQFDGQGADLGGITGRVGVGFGRYFALEGEAAVGVKDDAGTELDSEIGAFAVGKLPVTDRFDIFARAGVSRVETSPGGDDDGLAYGAGAQYFFTDKDGVRGDWTRHELSDATPNVDAYSVTYVRRF